MEPRAREAYLEAQIMTATPQKLRLMLIEGGIQFARQTIRHWNEDRNEEAFESLTRCRRVVTELLGSIRLDQTALTQTMSGLYAFLFKTLTEAMATRDVKKMEDVIRVLEEERLTWQEVCQQLPEVPPEVLDQVPEEITAASSATADAQAAGGFSLDA